MVDKQRHERHEQPTDRKQPPDGDSQNRLLDVPDYRIDPAPLPDQQEGDQASQQDVRAAFDRLRHETCPNPLERGARHDGMLRGKQSQ